MDSEQIEVPSSDEKVPVIEEEVKNENDICETNLTTGNY